MKRRDFLKKSALASTAFSLGGIPVKAMKQAGLLQLIASASSNNRAMVIIQMHGGNDGLNMVIPMDQYGAYYNARPNIAIPQNGSRKFIELDQSLPTQQKVGLHPDMTDAKSMYDNGKFAIVQNVSYANANGSHFRGRDILFMGGDANDYYSSGWMGRYLDYEFPGYPNGYPNPSMPDPLAIEIGSGMSLAFHRDQGIPVGLSVNGPIGFYNLINSVGAQLPFSFPNNHAGDEMEYIMQIEKESNKYAERLRDVYLAGSNSSVVYPDLYPYNAPPGRLHNPLTGQLKIIARLLSGGCKTKVFLCRIGGFDTHSGQVLQNDTTMGGHAALMYHIAAAMNAFYKDLNALSLTNRVLSFTMSEFGRRVDSNGAYGTDHGNAAPVMIFGDCINPGVYGNNPDLSNLSYGNIPMGFDYRQVYTTALADWFGADSGAIQAAKFSQWMSSRIDYINCKIGINETPDNSFAKIWPNPARNKVQLEFNWPKNENIGIQLLDLNGRIVVNFGERQITKGSHIITLPLQNIASGNYFIKLTSTVKPIVKKLVVIK